MLSKLAGGLCEQGHAADEANRRGDFVAARDSYLELLGQLAAEADALQAYLAAKAALGLLLCDIRSGQLRRAHELWARRSGPQAARHGIGLLERGHATAGDRTLYLMLSAYLTSVENSGDQEQASREVCALMSRVGGALDPTMRARAALNWRCHLEQIWQGQVPGRWLKQIVPPPAAGDSIAFLNPDAWHMRGIPQRIDPSGEFPLRPPRIEAPAPLGPQSRWWPWIWIGAGLCLGPLYSGRVSLLWLFAGALAGVVLSVPGWLLDYTLRRHQFIGVVAGLAATLLTLPLVRLPAWGWPFLLLWWCSAGAGLEIVARRGHELVLQAPTLEEVLALMGSENWPAALASLDRAIAKKPRDWRLLANRAVCQAVLDRPEQAESDFEEACQVLGPTGPARLEAVHGYLLWRQARDGSQDALQRAVRELRSEEIEGVRMRVACHVLDENWEAAHTVLEEGVRRHPRSSALRLDRARLHLAHGRVDAAVADLLGVIEHADQEGALREARAALLAIGAEPADPATSAPPDPEVYVSSDGHYSLWFPARPQSVPHGLYLRQGEVHYLLERSEQADAGMRLPAHAELRGELTWESRLTPDGEVLSPEVLMAPHGELEGMRQYSRVLSSGGDEMVTRRVVVPDGFAQARQVYALSVWGPQGGLDRAFQFLGSFAPQALGRRPAYLFLPAGPMPGKTVAIERGGATLYGLQGSLPWLSIWKNEARLTLCERPCVLEVDSLEGLRRSGDASLAPYHRFVAYQHLGPANSLGVRSYLALSPEDVVDLAAALQEGPAESLLLLSAGFHPGSIRALADRLDGLVYHTLGFFWCFSGDNLTDDSELAAEIAYAARILRCQRLSILTSALDSACRKLLLDGLRDCPDLKRCGLFARDEDARFPAFEVPEIQALLG